MTSHDAARQYDRVLASLLTIEDEIRYKDRIEKVK